MDVDYQLSDGADDPQALLLRCRNGLAQRRLQEAVECYNHGLTNQCVITAWQAVVLDYLAKLQDLAGWSEEAAEELRSYEAILRSNNVNKALEFERGLIKRAHATFGFIPGVNATDLEHLRDDRHRAAHPTMRGLDEPFKLAPTKALAHMQTAVDLMLSVPAFEGAGPSAELEEIISAEDFPITIAGARDRLLDSPLKGAGSGIIRELLYAQVEAALRGDDTEQLVVRRAVALAALRTMHEDEFKAFMPDILIGIVEGQGWSVGALLAVLWVLPFLWETLPDATRATLMQAVLAPLDGDHDLRLVHAYRLTALRDAVLARAADLPEAQLQRLAASVHRGEYAPLILAGILARKRPMLLVDSFHQWPDLVTKLPLSEALEAAFQIRLIGKASRPALDSVPTGAPKDLLGVLWRGAVIAGAVTMEIMSYDVHERIRSVAAGLRVRLETLGSEAALEPEQQAALQEAQAELQEIAARLGPLPDRPKPEPT